MGVEKGIVVRGAHELDRIPDPLSRIAAQFVFEQLYPGETVIIGHETDEFWYQNGDRIEGHRPDLSISLPERGEEYIRETTRSRKRYCVQNLHSLPVWLGKTDVVFSESGGIELLTVLVEYDPKSKQRRVMQHCAPDVDYDVWDGDYFEALHDKYPQYEFFPNK